MDIFIYVDAGVILKSYHDPIAEWMVKTILIDFPTTKRRHVVIFNEEIEPVEASVSHQHYPVLSGGLFIPISNAEARLGSCS